MLQGSYRIGALRTDLILLAYLRRLPPSQQRVKPIIMQRFLIPKAKTSNSTSSTASNASVTTSQNVLVEESTTTAPPSTLTHSEPPTASHKCYFEINESLLVYNRQQLKGVRCRPKTKRALHKNVKPSWVWNHGADIQAQGYDRLWLCKICHLKRDPKVGLLDARFTSTIIEHLRSKHHINPPGALKHGCQGHRRQMARLKIGQLHLTNYARQ